MTPALYPIVGELLTESSFEKSRQSQQYNLFGKELPQIQENFLIIFKIKLFYTFFCLVFVNPNQELWFTTAYYKFFSAQDSAEKLFIFNLSTLSRVNFCIKLMIYIVEHKHLTWICNIQ